MTQSFRSGFPVSTVVLQELLISSSEQELLYSLKSMNVAPWLQILEYNFFLAAIEKLISFVLDNIFIVKVRLKWLICTSTHEKWKVKNRVWIGSS